MPHADPRSSTIFPLRQREIDQWREKLLDPDCLDRIDFLRIHELITRLEAAVPAGVIRPLDEPVLASEVYAARAPFLDLGLPVISTGQRDIGEELLIRMEPLAQPGCVPHRPGESFGEAIRVLRTKDRISYDERQTIAAVFTGLASHLKPGLLVDDVDAPAVDFDEVDEAPALADAPR